MTAFKTLISVSALVLVTTPAFARQTKTVDINYQSFETYYSCSGAEDDLSELLRQLGAQKIETSCNGGLHEGYVDVHATFSVADSTDATASWQTVQIRSDAGCAFAQQALDQILPAFSTNNVDIDSNCGFNDEQPLHGVLTVWK